jgi:hypothetical protein
MYSSNQDEMLVRNNDGVLCEMENQPWFPRDKQKNGVKGRICIFHPGKLIN